LPEGFGEQQAESSPIYTLNEQQATSSGVYLDPNNVEIDPDPCSVYADPDPESVYTDPNLDITYYSDLTTHEAEEPLGGSERTNTNR
jgi:hypothetical protein